MSPNTIQNTTALVIGDKALNMTTTLFYSRVKENYIFFLQKINNNYKIDVKI